MEKSFRILVINPGSPSTTVAVFENAPCLGEKDLKHSSDELTKYDSALDQLDMRRTAILNYLCEIGIRIEDIDAIGARGAGRWGRYKAGAYEITKQMRDDCMEKGGTHGSQLSAILAYDWAQALGIKAYVYDVVPVDEMWDVCRISGSPLIERQGASHTLNTKATARVVAAEMGKRYEDVTFIMCHMGGGIGVNLHHHGQIIDVTSNDEGAFSPARAGRVPCLTLAKMCYSGKYTWQDINYLMNDRGGLVGYLGTNDCREVEERIKNGDKKAALVYEAMALQVAKDIGTMAVVVNGEVDRIVLTGGIAHSEMMCGMITSRVKFIASVVVKPGEMEQEALANGVLRVLQGKEKAWVYEPGINPA